MEMSKTDQIQIGMLGVIIVLMILQMSNVFGGDDLAASAKNDLVGNTTAITGTQPFNPAVGNPAVGNAATPPSAVPPTAPKVDPNQPKTVMAFGQQQYDFGTVNEGEIVKRTFKFKNTGKEPLLISNAQGSCGCTVPKWPKEPIAPGASSEITVEFNSDKKTGKRNQQVTITANTEPASTIISLVGQVTPKGGSPVAPAQ
jgi:hypothetical protein